MNISSVIRTVGVSLCLGAVLPAAADTPPVPSAYQDLYTSLNGYMDSFNATLRASWNGSQYPVIFSANLKDADANIGPQVIQKMPAILLQLQSQKAMGVKGVVVQCGFPILYEPFYSSHDEYQQFVDFYAQVAAAVRAAGLTLIVENQAVQATGMASGWSEVGDFYATLSWDQYQQARAQDAVTVAQTMRPDFLALLEEPIGEFNQTGQTAINTPTGAAAMISQVLTSLQQAAVPGVLVGAGTATDQPQFAQFTAAFTALPLDYINMHIYPVNFNFLPNALTMASMAAQAGKPVAVSEAWLWKMRDSDWNVLTPDQIRARNPFDFWAPLDAYFLQTMENLANYTKMPFMGVEGPEYFATYLPYSSTQNLSPTDILNQEGAAAALATQNAAFTSTALSYHSSLVAPPDTIPPSVPANFKGASYDPTIANLTWSSATDNVGVAGYYVSRNGTVVATTAQSQYQDTGLTGATTYSYGIVAFDLGGNQSVPSATVNVTTRDVTPPTPPATLTATPVTCQQIALSWSASTDVSGVAGYRIFRGPDAADLVQVVSVNATTYTDSKLTPATAYYYGVEALDKAGNLSAMSPIVFATTLGLPLPVTHLVATPSSATKILLTWTATTGGLPIASYHVYRGTSPANMTQVALVTNTSFNDTGLAAATTYYYAVQAVDTGHNLSPMSGTTSAVTFALPAAPSNLVATPSSGTQIALAWSAPVGGGLPIASYSIYRGSSCANLAQLAARTGNSYTDTSLTPGTTYCYAVQAVDTANDLSPLSNAVAATTPSLPTAPAGVRATASSSTQIGLSWNPSTGGLPIATYRIWRGPSSSSLIQITSRPGTSYTDTSLTPGTTYYYAVQAVDTANDVSPLSGTVSATTPTLPTAPTGLKATALSSTQIGLVWNPSSGGLPIGSYRIWRGSSCANLAQLVTRAGTSYTDTSLTPGTTYCYAVQAVDTANDLSPVSAPASATTPTLPTAPTGLKATPSSSTQIGLVWNPSTGGLPINTYRIWRGSSCASLAQLVSRTGTSYTDTSLTPGTTYCYAVQAADTANDLSPLSAAASATTPTLPTAPTGLTATPLSSTQIGLSWNPSTGGLPIATYRIYRGSSRANLVQVATRPGTTYTDTGLTPATTYYYAVQAVDTSQDVSPVSASIAAATPVLPSAPTNLTVTSFSAKQVSLSWSAAPSGLPLLTYHVFRGPTSSSLTQLKVVSAPQTSVVDFTVTSGTTYYYAVQAGDTGGDLSPMSAVVKVTTP